MKELSEKLSAKWIPVSERVPKLICNTLLFRGGIPEPTIYVWYDTKHNKWYNVVTNKEVIMSSNACWLDYGHSDYPDIKF